MEIVSWVDWDDNRFKFAEKDELFYERWKEVVRELRRKNYRFTGNYHQYGDHGVPMFDDGMCFMVSMRMWGEVMAQAFPETATQGEYAYCAWAWQCPEGETENVPEDPKSNLKSE